MDQEQAYAYIEALYGYEVIVLGTDGHNIFWIYPNETEDDVRVEPIV